MSSESAATFPEGPSCPVPLSVQGTVLLGHGSGGRLTAELIEGLILPAFRNPALEPLDDGAVLPVAELRGGARLAFTTDGHVVTPLFFPGGDIGQLAIHGTLNDLAMMGARPLGLSLGLILEEGLPLETLRRVIESARAAAERAGVAVVTGDTKVVGRGHADGIFISTSGVGLVPAGRSLGSDHVQPGDAVLVSGPIGDHGVAILACREGLALDGQVQSDTCALGGLVEALLEVCPGAHALRDPTRGGLAAVLVELASRRRLGVEVDETAIPVREEVRGACELLGLDPLLVANEGKLVAFVPGAEAGRALAGLRAHPLGREAAIIGEVTTRHRGQVLLRTPVGGERWLELPFHEPLPRIC